MVLASQSTSRTKRRFAVLHRKVRLCQEKRCKDETSRWITLGTEGGNDRSVQIALLPSDDSTDILIGKQSFAVQCDDFDTTYKQMKEKGIMFLGEPNRSPYRTDIALHDLYGNTIVVSCKLKK
jgi:hypothetical protein